MNFLIVTGLSGAGKSMAVNALEDIGFFCIDNIPAGLLPRILDFAQQGENQLSRVAVVMDIRGLHSVQETNEALEALDEKKMPYDILFLDASETAIMANAQSFIFWNSVFYIPLAVLIIYRYTIQGLGFSGLAMFAGVAEMIARAMVGFWFVPLWGYFAACIASPVAWFFACFFLIPAYFVVRKRLQKEMNIEKEHDARTANA